MAHKHMKGMPKEMRKGMSHYGKGGEMKPPSKSGGKKGKRG